MSDYTPSVAMTACIAVVRANGLCTAADRIEKAYKDTCANYQSVINVFTGGRMREQSIIKELAAQVDALHYEYQSQRMNHIMRLIADLTAPHEARRIDGNHEAQESVPLCTTESSEDARGKMPVIGHDGPETVVGQNRQAGELHLSSEGV